MPNGIVEVESRCITLQTKVRLVGCRRNKASECRNSNLKDVSCYLPSQEKEPLHRGSLESHSCCPPLITLWHSRCGGWGGVGLP